MIRSNKILIIFALAAVLFIGVSSWFIQVRLKGETRVKVEESLETVLETTRQALRSWVKEHRAAVMVWANTPEVQGAAEELLKLPGNRDALLSSPAQSRIRSWLHPIHTGQGYGGYFIIGPGNINLASSRDGNVGLESLLVRQGGFLDKVWSGQTAVSVPQRSDVPLPDSEGMLREGMPTMFVGAPVLDESGKVMAVFTFRLDPAGDFSKILEQGRIGKTGETYAFDGDGRLVSNSRFDGQLREMGLISAEERGMLNILIRENRSGSVAQDEAPLTKMAMSAISGESGASLDSYFDYRGVPVLGAWLWDRDLALGIATEIDEYEAYESFRTVQGVVSFFTLFSALLLLGLTAIYIFGRRQTLESESRLRQIIDLAPSMIHVKDRDGRFILANKAVADAYGTTVEDLVDCSQEEIHASPGEIEAIIKAERGVRESGLVRYVTDEVFIDSQGNRRILHAVRIPYEVSPRKGSALLTVATDITELKQSEEELRLRSILFKSTTEGMIVTDSKADIIAVNRAFTDITGYEAEEVLGQNPRIYKSDRHDKMFYKNMWARILKVGYWQGEIWNRRKDGEVFPVWQNISVVRDDDGAISNYVSVFSDISSIKTSHQMLDHLAHHDMLTDLPNRMLFEDRLNHAISRAKREKHKLALFFIDLDRFKNINDSLGHPVGDGLLQETAKRLKELIREEDTVARLGGDEFTIIMERIEKEEHASVLARRMMTAFMKPFSVRGHELHVTPSVGISIYPDDGEAIDVLIKNADVAMYRAKEEGRNNYQFYTEELTASVLERISIETKLRHALESEELFLHYQPQFSLETGEIIGAEALIRWDHPEMGMVSPMRFIPIAEDTGLIIPIGEWVLRTGCMQMKRWQEGGLHIERISINVSGVQIQRGKIVETVMKVLDETGLDSRSLELEITESTIMRDTERVVCMMNELREMGVQLAIDDFGTGFSSLSHLRNLPIDKLKIDRSFVRDIPRDLNAEAIARAVIALGKTLHLRIIAEGVETDEQEAFLLSEGCIEVQGYKYSRPLSVEAFTALLKASSNS